MIAKTETGGKAHATKGYLPPVVIPGHYNYIATFLTLSCNLTCSYCINRFDTFNYTKGHLTGAEWTLGLNRIVSRADLPITIGGGEPSLHPDFTTIINGIRPELNIDLLTNLEFDIDRFMAEVSSERIKRAAPYASIRVSYHPEVMVLESLIAKVQKLLRAGYSIGIWGVLHPSQETEILRAQEQCRQLGIDFRTKEFLGDCNGEMYGTIRYPGACDRTFTKEVECRTTELLIGPTGHIYRCHSDLYEGRAPVGHLLDPAFKIDNNFKKCEVFGHCNPCDVKVKTNRFQEYGHTSVEIILNEK